VSEATPGGGHNRSPTRAIERDRSPTLRVSVRSRSPVKGGPADVHRQTSLQDRAIYRRRRGVQDQDQDQDQEEEGDISLKPEAEEQVESLYRDEDCDDTCTWESWAEETPYIPSSQERASDHIIPINRRRKGFQDQDQDQDRDQEEEGERASDHNIPLQRSHSPAAYVPSLARASNLLSKTPPIMAGTRRNSPLRRTDSPNRVTKNRIDGGTSPLSMGRIVDVIRFSDKMELMKVFL